MNRTQVTGLSLESGQEGSGAGGLWKRQRDACDLSGARLGWGQKRGGQVGDTPAVQAEPWTQSLCCFLPRDGGVAGGRSGSLPETVLRLNDVLI